MHRIGLPYTQRVSMPAAARVAARAAQERSVRGSDYGVSEVRATLETLVRMGAFQVEVHSGWHGCNLGALWCAWTHSGVHSSAHGRNLGALCFLAPFCVMTFEELQKLLSELAAG